ncbi:hypothetical protein VFPBJ_03383 [Purpureocillium lilacinum]|uniref:Uncharacterized protein n=1 Tax=Purpureocillium lilacinum TaxID=33203 RepID=A0A179H2Y7_PURLI|nr:hypothetical protein VFPBJ_03383 [Purpureocillium lilacinum]
MGEAGLPAQPFPSGRLGGRRSQPASQPVIEPCQPSSSSASCRIASPGAKSHPPSCPLFPRSSVPSPDSATFAPVSAPLHLLHLAFSGPRSRPAESALPKYLPTNPTTNPSPPSRPVLLRKQKE